MKDQPLTEYDYKIEYNRKPKKKKNQGWIVDLIVVAGFVAMIIWLMLFGK